MRLKPTIFCTTNRPIDQRRAMNITQINFAQNIRFNLRR